MPAKNTLRQFTEDQYLHVYNRGVEKRKIFITDDDYEVFLYYLFIYLSDPIVVEQKEPKLKPTLKRKNLFGKVELIAFCLMPNHFHLLLHQNEPQATSKLLKQITNAYTRYFNSKYKRVGPLMQGRFKASIVDKEVYLLQLTRYIHQNPLKINFVLPALRNYSWSSYPIYLGSKDYDFLNPAPILAFFNNTNPNLTYESFVEEEVETKLADNLVLEVD